MTTPNNPLRNTRHLNALLPYVTFPKRPTTTDIRHPETGQIYQRPYFWVVRNKADGSSPASGSAGEFWYLQDITANVANWVMFNNVAATGVLTISGDTGGAVSPDVGGDLDHTGTTVANATNAKPLLMKGTPGSNLVDAQIQIGATVSPTPIDKNDAGLLSANVNHFTVDATSGMLSLKNAGGNTPPITLTGDDANAVSADGVGDIDILGSTVANATNAKPLYFKNTSANTLTAQIQVAKDITGAPGDKNDAGLASFDDTAFAVDADGYVSLIGGSGTIPMVSLTGDDSTVISPNGSGNIDIQGSTVANATNAKPVYVNGTALSNLEEIEVQVAAAITGSPADKNNAGLASFDDTYFSVDANGYVSFIAALAGFTWNTVTGTSQNAAVSNGYITNNASLVTVNLPSTFAVGDTIKVVGEGAGGWKIQLQAGDTARIGTQVTSSGGTVTSNNRYDNVELIGLVANTSWRIINSHGSVSLT